MHLKKNICDYRVDSIKYKLQSIVIDLIVLKKNPLSSA